MPENEKKDLMDPMVDDTEDSLKEKREIWNEIFTLHPELADALIGAAQCENPNVFYEAARKTTMALSRLFIRFEHHKFLAKIMDTAVCAIETCEQKLGELFE